MPPKNFYKVCLLFILLSGTLLACGLSSTATYNNGTPVVSTTPPSTPALNQWVTGSPGVEIRYEIGKVQATMKIL